MRLKSVARCRTCRHVQPLEGPFFVALKYLLFDRLTLYLGEENIINYVTQAAVSPCSRISVRGPILFVLVNWTSYWGSLVAADQGYTNVQTLSPELSIGLDRSLDGRPCHIRYTA